MKKMNLIFSFYILLVFCFLFFACDEIAEMEKREKKNEQLLKQDTVRNEGRLEISFAASRKDMDFYIITDKKTGKQFLLSRYQDSHDSMCIVELKEGEKYESSNY
jgi:hypothetical protein